MTVALALHVLHVLGALTAGSLVAPVTASPADSLADVPRQAVGLWASAVAPSPERDWRQEVHYTIEAVLDENAQLLRGSAVLEYGNASPDTLDRLYLHLHLNAFRPNSVWARTERRAAYQFQDLADPEHGFERLRTVRVGDRALTPSYPHAPDSTVARLDLPDPLPPEGRLVLQIEWDARPSTLCRRQCRQGRHWDLAQWYPRIAVYDAEGWQAHPLYPQGEFYGEFGAYDVTLELASDQVVGATGVVLEGDPGWRTVQGRASAEEALRREAYADPRPPRSPGLLARSPEEGSRRVRFYAEEVIHFAWSANPDFRYEGGEHRGVSLHVLFRPDAAAEWSGTVVERTVEALNWLEGLFGPYPYPQLTTLHRLEGGGTEFPMLIMNGSANLGLIVHEVAHQFAHAVLANNEWKEAWLDEGLTSFLTNWFFEERGDPDVWAGLLARVRAMERAGATQPIAIPSHEFVDFDSYVTMTYAKAALVFRMLRWYVGEETFREILRAYYDEYRLRHVDEAAFRRVAAEVAGEDLDWFFDQWLHTTHTLDYAVEDASTERLPDGRWETRVTVVREGEAWMPVDLRVAEKTVRLEGRERRQEVTVVTDGRPRQVELDPDRVLLDSNRTTHLR